MRKIEIEIPDGKEAKWVNDVLTLVDEQPKVKCRFNVGDWVHCGPLDGVVISYTNSNGAVCYRVLDDKSYKIVDVDFDSCVKLIDKQPIEFKFKMGDKVYIKGDLGIYTIVGTVISYYRPHYFLGNRRGGFQEDELELYIEKPKDITEHINTFEDAYEWCEENGKRALTYEYDVITRHRENVAPALSADIIAYLKLRIITCALNEGWEPTYEDGEERYAPYLPDFVDKDTTYATIHLGPYGNSAAKLIFKNEILAEYAANQFKDIYIDFCYKEK